MVSPTELRKPAAESDTSARPGNKRPARSVRSRVLRSTAMLPALFTISNGLLGFAAICVATRQAATFEAHIASLTFAAWLILGAMVCDMLDGRLARMTRRTSDFGGQLDSLCDVISFGIAPAILALHTSLLALDQWVSDPLPGRAVWCAASVYVACAALRLARFNVENEPDESAHMEFEGLPTPGAAAAVCTLVLLLGHLMNKGWFPTPTLLLIAGIALPVVTLAAGVLMVSRLRYPHPINQYIRGRRSFGYLVKLVILVIAAALAAFITGAVVALGYVLLGPVGAVRRKLRKHTRGAA